MYFSRALHLQAHSPGLVAQPSLLRQRLATSWRPQASLSSCLNRGFHSSKALSEKEAPKQPPADEHPIQPIPFALDIPNSGPHNGTIWFDNIFPIRYWKYDPRWVYVRRFAAESAERAHARLIPEQLPVTFNYIDATPNWKEGGLFVHFSTDNATTAEVVEHIKQHIQKNKLRSWMNLQTIRVFEVEGQPWVDDMLGRLPAEVVKVEFYGPDVSIEDLFREFRVYGKIVDITLQPPSVKDVPRYAMIEFMRVRSATSARNCLNQKKIKDTVIRISYNQQRKAWESLWNWISSHPRISIPVLLGLLAGMTYVIFDPIRVFFITNKLTGRYSLEKYTGAAEQLWTDTTSRLGSVLGHRGRDRAPISDVAWTERQADLERLQHHLQQTPDTVVLVSGPKGSGKSQLVRKAVENSHNKMVIHLDELAGQPPHIMLNRLATQINFKPMFNWLVQMSSMIDTMITATTGAKAGLSTTNEGQIRKMLELLSQAVTATTLQQKAARDKVLAEQRMRQRMEQSGEVEKGKLLKKDKDTIATPVPEVHYPVIVVEGVLASESTKGSMINDLIIEWAALAAEYHLAHVILISDNPTAIKTVSRAMPNKPIEFLALSDATFESAMSVVERRLDGKEPDAALASCVKGLGGRLTDLEVLVQKIRAGMTPTEAYSEIVSRAVSELRKLGLFEDAPAGSTSWTPIQFWLLATLLTTQDFVSYDALRFHALFKGDAAPLHAMERTGVISLMYDNGRPFGVKPARPVHRAAFEEMQRDKNLAAVLQILTVKQLTADEENNIKSCTAELERLLPLSTSKVPSVKYEVQERMDMLGKSIGASVQKIKDLGVEVGDAKAVVKLVTK
ncbi:RNA12 protein-domain-containing protein [Phlyctochytrium arcticum]|nr:RNA12 protein-domain-containing protein [Phlyctochytrium arcticum]